MWLYLTKAYEELNKTFYFNVENVKLDTSENST